MDRRYPPPPTPPSPVGPRNRVDEELRALTEAITNLMGQVAQVRDELHKEFDDLGASVLKEIGRLASLLTETRKQLKTQGITLEDSQVHDLRYLNEQMKELRRYDRQREKQHDSEAKWLRRRLTGRIIDIVVSVGMTALVLGLLFMAWKLLTGH